MVDEGDVGNFGHQEHRAFPPLPLKNENTDAKTNT